MAYFLVFLLSFDLFLVTNFGKSKADIESELV